VSDIRLFVCLFVKEICLKLINQQIQWSRALLNNLAVVRKSGNIPSYMESDPGANVLNKKLLTADVG
jgi:hypothetical protein